MSQAHGQVFDETFTAHADESYFGHETGLFTGSVHAEGARHGFGEMRYECGDVYEGQWECDRCCGLGVKTYENGDVYDGQWKDSKQHGTGRFAYAGGYEYVGGFDAGRYAGHGVMRLKGEVVCEGNWSTWEWTKGSWDMPYPREGGRGTVVTARKSSGPKAPRASSAFGSRHA